MVKRAGLMDTEAGVVRAPSLSAGTSPAAAQAYMDLAEAAGQITKTFIKPMVDKATEKRALDAVERGDFQTTPGITAQDMIYDKIIDAGFMAKASTDVERIAGELENKRLSDLNVQAFQEEFSEARNQYLEELDSRYAVPLRQAWDERGLRSTQRLSTMATQKAIKDASESLKARLSLKVDQLAGVSDYGEPDAQQALGEVEALHAAQVATGDKTQEEADAEMAQIFGRFTGNRVALEAVALYEAGGFSEAAYSESMKMIETTLASTDLAMSRSERAAYEGAARQSLNAIRSERRAAEADLNRRIREARSEALGEFSVLYADAKTVSSQGFGVDVGTMNELKRLAGSIGKPTYFAKIEELERVGLAQNEMRGRSIPEQEAMIAEVEQVAAQGNNLAAVALDSMRAVYGANVKAATADPVAFAAQQEKRDIPQIDFSTPDRAVETMGVRFASAENDAGSLGVPVKYFSPAQRTQIKTVAEKGGADALQLAEAIVAGANAGGVNPLAVFEEVAGAGAPLMAVAGGLMAQGADSRDAMRILSGTQAMKTDLVKDKMPKVTTQAKVQRDMAARFGRSLPQDHLDSLTRAFDAHYATVLVENNGVVDGSEEQAYQRSAMAVMGRSVDETGKAWGGFTEVNRKAVIVPPWIRQSDFPIIVKSLNQKDVETATGALPGRLGFYGGRAATMADYRSSQLVPVTTMPGFYYVVPDPKFPEARVLQSDGAQDMPVILDLHAIRETLKQRLPTAVR